MESRLKSGSRSYHRIPTPTSLPSPYQHLHHSQYHNAHHHHQHQQHIQGNHIGQHGGDAQGFRRSRSLRLRGEVRHPRLSPRSPLAPSAFPAITEGPGGYAPRDGAPANGGGLPHRQRSLSLSAVPHKSRIARPKEQMSKGGYISPITPPGSPEDLPDDESLHSYSSAATAASCDGAYAPFNGTTFSGRSMRYVLHCSAHAGLSGDEYLTPTQRAQRQIRRLKALLSQAKSDLEKKDSEIFRLTKEVVELRLYKASLSSPDDKSTSSDIITVRENEDDLRTPDSPTGGELVEDQPSSSIGRCEVDGPRRAKSESHARTPPTLNASDLQSSFTDSGHFEDMTNSSVHSKDSVHVHTQDACCSTDPIEREEERLRLISFYEKKIEEIARRHSDETQEMKRLHNDKVETLLQKLTDVNERYCQLVPSCEQAKERIRELEKQLEDVSNQLDQEEQKHHKTYLEMYNKGVEAAKLEQADKVLELSHASPSRVSVPELLQQLQITQQELDNIRAMYRRIVEAQGGSRSVDAETTLQFLKSAIYYLLTDSANHSGHLRVIESILGFTDAEKRNIQKARAAK